MKRDLNTRTLTIALLLSLVSVNIINTNETPLMIDTIKKVYQEEYDLGGRKRDQADSRIAPEVHTLIFSRIAVPTDVDEFGMTPLMWAARLDAKEILKTLLKSRRVKASINQPDKFGNTALLHALWASERTGMGNYEDVVLLLLQEKADPNVRNHEGKTPLIYAAQTANPKIISILADRFDAEITDEAIRQAKTKEAKTLLELLQKKKRDGQDFSKCDSETLTKIIENPRGPIHIRFGAGPKEKEPYRREGQ